jgi:hypothetical protein
MAIEPNLIVAGAGTTVINDVYSITGVSGGRPSYVNGYETGDMVWQTSQWSIRDSTYVVFYYSTDDVATPDLCTTWTADSGDLPVPTVTVGQQKFPNIVVSGAGSIYVNGTYISNRLSYGRPRYVLSLGGVIYFNGTGWEIFDPGGVSVYSSADDVATPDLCTTWTVVDGDAPVPTVTEESAGASGGGFPILNGSIVR